MLRTGYLILYDTSEDGNLSKGAGSHEVFGLSGKEAIVPTPHAIDNGRRSNGEGPEFEHLLLRLNQLLHRFVFETLCQIVGASGAFQLSPKGFRIFGRIGLHGPVAQPVPRLYDSTVEKS